MVLLFLYHKLNIKHLKKIGVLLIAVLFLIMSFFISGCTKKSENVLVIASEHTGNINPLTAKGYDKKIINLIFSDLITVDREGKILKNASIGEYSLSFNKNYFYEGIVSINETTDFIFAIPVKIFTFILRKDIRFSDGITLNADDCIFTLYSLLDESYDGSLSLNMLNIMGYDKYSGKDYDAEELAEFNEKFNIPQNYNGISGIIKNDDFSFSVIIKEGNASDLYRFCGVKIMPLHYYGDVSKYDYCKGTFGFTKGDITPIKNNNIPVGSGSYKFMKNTLNCIYLEKNSGYYMGEPNIPYICFQVQNPDNAGILVDYGICDIAFPSVKRINMEEIEKLDNVKISLWNSPSFGYIGINAVNVCVDTPNSSKSKYLREGLIMLINSERDIAVNTYYGTSAEVIDIPLSLNAANSEYLKQNKEKKGEVLSQSEVLQKVKENFIKAGYVFENEKVVFAPENAKLCYKAMLSGEGKGEHPSFDILTGVKEKLNNWGMDIEILDCADSFSMWSKLKAGDGEIWCAAAGGGYISELYSLYHSSNAFKNNYFAIKDKTLDKTLELLMRDCGSKSALYTQNCLNILNEWKVITPVYRRKECMIFNKNSVDNLTENPTYYYGILNDIHNIEMKRV